jgi:hypothetical protein
MNVNGFTSKASAIRHIRNAGFITDGLLSDPESNPKVAKNGKLGVLTSPLHLAPARLSGFETCAMRTAGCTAACLHTAGNPAYMSSKHTSRIAKTKAYFTERSAFMAVLVFEIAALARKAQALGFQTGVRLNATSDIPWEAVGVVVDGVKHRNLMDLFPEVEFYDYTKITKRALKFGRGELPKNYHLTFSRTGENDAACTEVLLNKGNVAAVFSLAKTKEVLASGTYGGFPVVDGDAHDFRPVDGKGVIVVLKAKGQAKSDTSGFVVR